MADGMEHMASQRHGGMVSSGQARVDHVLFFSTDSFSEKRSTNISLKPFKWQELYQIFRFKLKTAIGGRD